MTSDRDLKALLPRQDIAFDPSLRMRVLLEVNLRRARRAARARAAAWLAGGIVLGLALQPMTVGEGGAPALEAAAMVVSAVAATLVAVTAAAAGHKNPTHWLQSLTLGW